MHVLRPEETRTDSKSLMRPWACSGRFPDGAWWVQPLKPRADQHSVPAVACRTRNAHDLFLHPSDPTGKPDFDPALRAIMFTDIVDSTGMTRRLGDTRAVEMIRAHDALVQRSLKDSGGRTVKHTGDGIMASFDVIKASVECACSIQQAFAAFNLASEEKLRVRIGIDAGEPVADSNDLFGATVQMAARLCQMAEPDAILVSSTLHANVSSDLKLTGHGSHLLKGFPSPVDVYVVEWRNS